MSNNATTLLEMLTWQEARAHVIPVNPELAEAIDKTDPSSDYKLYRVRYPFGTTIVENGVFYLPTEDGQIAPIDSGVFSEKTVKDLNYYKGIATSVVLKNSAELFVGQGDSVIPFGILQKGRIFGLWRVLDSLTHSWHIEHIWNVTAGARSLVMLPKITDSIGYMRLKKEFGIKPSIPKKLHQQWHIFKALANQGALGHDWYVEFLLFPRQWFETPDKDPKWLFFKNFILQSAWQNTEYWRNQSTFEFVFSCLQQSRNLKPNPYLADTVKHLIAISAGAAPGFVVANDESAAPISTIQRIFTDIYNLKNYAPLMMHLKHMYYKGVDLSYYSLQNPTTLEFSPKSRSLSSNMVDLHEIKYIMDKYVDAVLDGTLPLENAAFKYFAERIKFYYYHTGQDTQDNVEQSQKILKRDNDIHLQMKSFPDRVFPENSPFFKGCISIDFDEA